MFLAGFSVSSTVFDRVLASVLEQKLQNGPDPGADKRTIYCNIGITRRIAVAQLRLRFNKSMNQCKTVGLVFQQLGKYISTKEQVRKLPVLWQVQHLVRVQVDLVAARLGNAASQVR